MISSETTPTSVLSSAACPECQSPVTPEQKPMVCEILLCGDCDAELEVVGMQPLVLALAPEVEEDWGE